tara:strand:- start:1434 stop:1613 length:180 start_codon:yes stop_codon:yes gene_type:complete
VIFFFLIAINADINNIDVRELIIAFTPGKALTHAWSPNAKLNGANNKMATTIGITKDTT